MQSNLFANSLQTTLLIPAIVCFSVVFSGCLVYILKNNKRTTLNAFIKVFVLVLCLGGSAYLGGCKLFQPTTITFDAETNGGVYQSQNGSNPVIKVNKNTQEIDLYSTERYATKNGWEFVGWNTDKNATDGLASFKTENLKNNVTLYAIYSKTLTASFYQIEESNSTDITVTIYNNQTTGEITTPAISNKNELTINGWGKSCDSSEKFVNGEEITSINADTNFYAIYSYDVVVTYNGNENTSGTMDTLTSTAFLTANGTVTPTVIGAEIELAVNTFVKDDYVFTRWAKDSTLGVKYWENDIVTIDKDTVFYALWAPYTEYTITYVLSGGHVSGNPTTYDSTVTITLKNPTKEGYSFIGWTGSNGSTPQTEVVIKKGTTGNMRFIANWEINAGYLSANWQKKIPNIESITSIEFTNEKPTVGTVYQIGATDENGTTEWTESSDSGCGVYAYLSGTTLKIYSQETVYAPKDSSYLFAYREYLGGLLNLSSITFNDLFNTSFVTNMKGMFSGCSKLTTLDLSSFDTSLVADMSFIFSYCSKLTTLDLSGLDTFMVTTMSGMFNGCEELTTLNLSDLYKFDTYGVKDMSSMFNGCEALTTLNLSDFDTSLVTNMSNMFSHCRNLSTLNLSNFDTHKVTNMRNMFSNCDNLSTLNISNFDTSLVTDMSNMFSNCDNLSTLNISNFDTSLVTDMSNMFSYCSKLATLDLSSFNIKSGTNVSNMFSSCDLLKTIVSPTTVLSSVSLNTRRGVIWVGSANNALYNSLPSSKITLNAGAVLAPNWKYAVTTTNITSYVFEENSSTSGEKVGATSLTDTSVLYNDTVNVYTSGSTMYIRSYFKIFAPQNSTSLFANLSGTFSFSNFDTSQVINMSLMFYGCSKLTSLTFNNFNTSNVTNMSYMFSGCSALKSISFGTNFNTSNVTNMANMFSRCSSLASISFGTNFKTTNVTNMSYMFDGCSKLTSLTFNSNFKTSNVTNMASMFLGCSGLTSISFGTNFKTTNVTDMSFMFAGCSSLTSISLSSFNTAKVTNMSYMFNGCSGLTTLSLTSFSLASITSNQAGFIDGCSNLDTINTPSTIPSTFGLDISTAPKRYRTGSFLTPRVKIINNSVVNVEIHSY